MGNQNRTEQVRIITTLRSAYDSYKWTVQRIHDQEQNILAALRALELDMSPIRMLTTQSNQKHLVVTKGNSILGWLPSEDNYKILKSPIMMRSLDM